MEEDEDGGCETEEEGGVKGGFGFVLTDKNKTICNLEQKRTNDGYCN
jgi:hypothetical protein